MSRLLIRASILAAAPFLLGAIGWELAAVYFKEIRRDKRTS